MKKPWAAFNIYLALLLVFAAGCQSTSRKKEVAQLRLFLEVPMDTSGRNTPVTIGRAERFVINAETTPFINEGNIAKAWVVDGVGGFQIMLQFDRRGTWLLDQYSVANKGRRAAILASFPPAEPRWIAAPVMANRISDGTLVFTPDATREEAERLVRGLTNVAKEVQKNNP